MANPENIVFITGATAGIGQACAEIFARNGYDLILTGRREDRLHVIADTLRDKYHRHVLSIVYDVRDREACEEAVHNLPEKWRKISILINNAGLALDKSNVQEGNPDDWDVMIDTNVKGLLYMTRLVAPIMIGYGGGHILNIGSLAGQEVYPGGNVYCATKFAVNSLGRSMRLDLVEHGIRVTNIAPGLVETEFSVVRFKGDEGAAKAVYDGFDPLTATDIADAVYWAASRPLHVNIDEITLTPRAQGLSRTVVRGKGY